MKESNTSATTATTQGANTMLPALATWFTSRGISPKTATDCGVYTQDDGNGPVIVFRFLENGECVNEKFRGKDKRFWQTEGGKKTFFNHQAIKKAYNDNAFLVITEGEMDCLAVIEAGYPYVVSLPDGAVQKEQDYDPDPLDDGKFQAIWNNWENGLELVQRFILAGDDDEPGRITNSELQRRFGVESSMKISYPKGCKDFNDVLMKFGAEKVLEVIEQAVDYPVRGLYQLTDFPDVPKPALTPTGITTMDNHLLIERGRFMVCTGIPSHGKSEFMERILFNLAKTWGWHTTVGTFENEPNPGYRDNMRHRYHSKAIGKQSVDEKKQADAWINKHFNFICQNPLNDEDEDLTLEDIIKLTEISVQRYGTKCLIIDPWNEIEHKRQKGEREDEYINRAIRQLKRLAKRFKILVIVVAHPTKMSDKGNIKKPTLYDISGGATWYNKADYGIVVWRDDVRECQTDIIISKVKFQRYAGKPGILHLEYDRARSDYDPYISEIDKKFAK